MSENSIGLKTQVLEGLLEQTLGQSHPSDKVRAGANLELKVRPHLDLTRRSATGDYLAAD